jgi:hypothetical protein
MTEPAKELIFYQDTSSHHHMSPDRLLSTTIRSSVDRGLHASIPLANVTAQDILRDLNNCRWTNPNLPDDAPKLVLHPGMGSLFSLADTSPEYSSASSY